VANEQRQASPLAAKPNQVPMSLEYSNGEPAINVFNRMTKAAGDSESSKVALDIDPRYRGSK